MGGQSFPEEMGYRWATPVLGVEYLPLSYGSGRFQRAPKQHRPLLPVLVFPSELHGKTPLLKIQCALVVGHKGIKPEISENLLHVG